MSSNLKICEHESVEWVIRKLPKFNKNIFFKKLKTIVTSFDVNPDIFIIGTNTGYLYYMNRKNSITQTLLLKKDRTVSEIKVIHTIDLSIAAGMEDGSVFILKIPLNKEMVFNDANQFIVPVDHTSAITSMAWSKNSEKLFTGDSKGSVFCTDINNINRTVSSYRICDTSSEIFQLSYCYKSLIVSNEKETFIFNVSTNTQSTVGTKSRQLGQYGACFIDKLCRSEEVEIVVVRPDSKIWISDLNGVVKRSISFKSEVLFVPEKNISLLPSVTSQSNSGYIGKVQTGVIKHQLGLVNPINETEVLFWSKNGIIIFDVSTGKIILSSCSLGFILSVSICRFNNASDSDSTFGALHESKDLYKSLSEIWILRKPIRDEESTLVRLSSLPLITSKLIIDPFLFFSESSDSKFSDKIPDTIQDKGSDTIQDKGSVEFLNTDQETLVVNYEDVTVPAKNNEHWMPNFDIKVPEKLQEMRCNVLELTKKTKEIFKHHQDIFESADEGVEQAFELTEEGLLIKFDNKPNDDLITSNSFSEERNVSTITDDIFSKNTRKNPRKVHLVDIGDNSLEDDPLKETSEMHDNTIGHHSDSDLINTANQILSTAGNLLESQTIHNEQEIEDTPNLYDEISLSINENTLSMSTCDRLFPMMSSDNYSDNITDRTESGSKSFESSHDPYLSIDTRNSIDICNPGHISNNNTGFSENSEEIYCPGAVISDKSNEISTTYNTEEILECSEESVKSTITENKLVLTDEILSGCNKWISHRGPTLGSNKITSLSINRRMIWLADTKGSLHIGFRCTEEELNDKKNNSSVGSQLQWFQDNVLQTDKIYSSPEGVIVWRDKSGDISVYKGMTKIWTPKVVKEKVLLKSNWETMMMGIKDIDIDNDMAVIVTKNGKLKVMNEISGRNYYKQVYTASVTGNVTLATTFNGIIWCVTEIVDPDSTIALQHIFACLAKDEDKKLNISYWRTVPVPKDLIGQKEKHLGHLGGSSQIRSLHLGVCGLAWIVTFQNQCFFSQHISVENPTGDGIWYQISLNFLFNILTTPDENAVFGLDSISYGIQSRVEKIFGHPDLKSKRTNSSVASSSLLISVKSAPKRFLGNGLVWVTCIEKNSPTILFESDKDLLGHGWFDYFSSTIQKKTISLPATSTWASITFGFQNVLWLISNTNEIFCYWKGTRIRNIIVPSSLGKVIQITAHDNVVLILTIKSSIFMRTGLTTGNPLGTDWKEINSTWNLNKEIIKHISCYDNEVWLITAENIYYTEDLRSQITNIAKKTQWLSINIKLNETFTNTFSMIQVIRKSLKRYIWACSDPDGYIYLGIWNNSIMSFDWTYIPGPRAKSVHVSNENVWMTEQFTGEIFVRCGINWSCKATGDYWTHVPISTAPVISLSVSENNDVLVIDKKLRLKSHYWTVVKSSVTEQKAKDTVELVEIGHNKSVDNDWELLEQD